MVKTAIDGKRRAVTEFRRSEILRAAARVFSARGFERARMDDISAEAGLAKATVYAYFRSKDEIYESVVEQAIAELSQAAEEQIAQARDFPSRLRAFIRVRLGFWQRKQSLYRLILNVDQAIPGRKRTLRWQRQAVQALVGLFREASREGTIPAADFEGPAWALMDMIRGINIRRLTQAGPAPAGEAERLADFMLRGLGARTAAVKEASPALREPAAQRRRA